MDIVVSALVGECFKFPKGTELVSAVYAVSFSKDIRQPVEIGIQHCVSLENEEQAQQLVFAKTPLHEPLPPHFKLIEGGEFPFRIRRGFINITNVTSCLIGILKFVNSGQSRG